MLAVRDVDVIMMAMLKKISEKTNKPRKRRKIYCRESKVSIATRKRRAFPEERIMSKMRTCR